MDTILTRCPSCQTAFNVKQQVLTRASGKVRCGACLQVFNAIEHEVIPQSSPMPVKEPIATTAVVGSGLSAIQALSQAREQSLQKATHFDHAQLDLNTGELKPIADPSVLDSYGIFSLDEEEEKTPEQPSMALFFGLADEPEEDASEHNPAQSKQADMLGDEIAPSASESEQQEQSEELPWWEQEFIFSDEEPDFPLKDEDKTVLPKSELEINSQQAEPRLALAEKDEPELDFNLNSLAEDKQQPLADDSSLDLFFTADTESADQGIELEILDSEQELQDVEFINLPADSSLELLATDNPSHSISQDPDDWANQLLEPEPEPQPTVAESIHDSHQDLPNDSSLMVSSALADSEADTDDETADEQLTNDQLLQQAYQDMQELDDPFGKASSHLQSDAIILPNIKDDELLTEHRPRSSWLWTLGSLLLLSLLLAQYLWIDRERWQHQPLLAGYYQFLCQWADCPVELISQPERIRTLRLDARQDPTDAGQIEITAIIINQGSAPQPWPIVQISFFDLQGRLVNMSLIRPEDYLDFASSSLAANEPVQIFFRVENPGPNADARLSFIRP